MKRLEFIKCCMISMLTGYYVFMGAVRNVKTQNIYTADGTLVGKRQLTLLKNKPAHVYRFFSENNDFLGDVILSTQTHRYSTQFFGKNNAEKNLFITFLKSVMPAASLSAIETQFYQCGPVQKAHGYYGEKV